MSVIITSIFIFALITAISTAPASNNSDAASTLDVICDLSDFEIESNWEWTKFNRLCDRKNETCRDRRDVCDAFRQCGKCKCGPWKYECDDTVCTSTVSKKYCNPYSNVFIPLVCDKKDATSNATDYLYSQCHCSNGGTFASVDEGCVCTSWSYGRYCEFVNTEAFPTDPTLATLDPDLEHNINGYRWYQETWRTTEVYTYSRTTYTYTYWPIGIFAIIAKAIILCLCCHYCRRRRQQEQPVYIAQVATIPTTGNQTYPYPNQVYVVPSTQETHFQGTQPVPSETPRNSAPPTYDNATFRHDAPGHTKPTESSNEVPMPAPPAYEEAVSHSGSNKPQ